MKTVDRSARTAGRDEQLDLLLQINAELDQLLATPRRPDASLSRADRERLATLLPAIAGALGSELFSSAEVLEHDAAALQLVCAGLTAKKLGRLLRRAVDIPLGGYLVQRQGAEAGAVLWRIVQVPELLRDEKVLVPHAAPRGRV